jgi:16S rRNA (guanine527-N7)-methyltransferase
VDSLQKGQKPQGYWRLPELAPDLTKDQLALLEMFYVELIRFNQKLDLIPRRTELDADVVHFLDSIESSKIILSDTKAAQIFDFGSGNGLPGIVLAILDPSRQVVLADTDERKCEFLKHVIGLLKLKNVTVLMAAVEDLEPGMVSCAISRGSTRISKTIIGSRRVMRSGGDFYHLRGSSWVTEVAEIPSQLCTFWSPGLVKEYNLPVVFARMAVIKTKRLG